MVGSNKEEFDDEFDDDEDIDFPTEKAAGANRTVVVEGFVCGSNSHSFCSSSSSLLQFSSAENELRVLFLFPMPAIPVIFEVLPEEKAVRYWTLLIVGVLSEGAMAAAARARLLPALLFLL